MWLLIGAAIISIVAVGLQAKNINTQIVLILKSVFRWQLTLLHQDTQ